MAAFGYWCSALTIIRFDMITKRGLRLINKTILVDESLFISCRDLSSKLGEEGQQNLERDILQIVTSRLGAH